jgi:hypothetical protein
MHETSTAARPQRSAQAPNETSAANPLLTRPSPPNPRAIHPQNDATGGPSYSPALHCIVLNALRLHRGRHQTAAGIGAQKRSDCRNCARAYRRGRIGQSHRARGLAIRRIAATCSGAQVADNEHMRVRSGSRQQFARRARDPAGVEPIVSVQVRWWPDDAVLVVNAMAVQRCLDTGFR